VTRAKALQLNRARYRLAETGGSDAHFLSATGTSFTTFEGSSADDLRTAIIERRTAGEMGPDYPQLSEIGYGRIVYQQLRSWTVTPRRVIGRPLVRALRRDRAR
jgi:hypothetical protein